MQTNIFIAFFLTLLAGLSTGVGGLIALLSKTTNRKFLSLSLGFSAGVMIYISMVEIFAKANYTLSLSFGNKFGYFVTVVSFFGGIVFTAIIDNLIPSYENPHEVHVVEDMKNALQYKDLAKLKRAGIFVAIAIAIHNFPEGFATFMGALQSPKLGIAIAFAIAIHNIPEGISVSVPIYFATKSRRKAFLYSLLSGLAEPFGAIIGFLILRPFINPTVFGIFFAFVAGIMVYISFDELLPSAKECGNHHLSICGLIFGMLTMAISLLIFI